MQAPYGWILGAERSWTRCRIARLGNHPLVIQGRISRPNRAAGVEEMARALKCKSALRSRRPGIREQ
eukprot:2574798-Pyramimonas_sp.AAC.1